MLEILPCDCRWRKFTAADLRLVQHGVQGVQGARQLLRLAPLGGDRGHPHADRVRVEPRDQGGHRTARHRQDANLQCLETQLPRGKNYFLSFLSLCEAI